MKEIIFEILGDMAEELSVMQLKKLQEVLIKRMMEKDEKPAPASNDTYLEMFINAKKIEGCSARTLKYYQSSVQHMFSMIKTPVRKITTEDLREYLTAYQKINNCGKSTVDNIRRNISSFFSWLEEEDHILKSPMRRIHKIKTETKIKETISDEDIEKLRDQCKSIRDIAMIDLLYSTGIRVGELVNLDRKDINFEERECIVYGKGEKERRVYFDAKTKLHLQNYIASRNDTNPALFVTLDEPHDRLKISGVEIRVRKLGRSLNMSKIHPHKFRNPNFNKIQTFCQHSTPY